MTAAEAPRAAPLAGLLVLDLGQIYNGPYCGWLLAQMGAEVIKVESPAGDLVRARTHDPRGPFAHLALNADKRGIVLDLKRPAGREVLLRLVDHADVLVENFSVGALERLGLGAEVLAERNPRLVHGSGTGYGSTGPYATLGAMDLTVQAMSGLLSATGEADRTPVKSGGAVTDFLGGVHLALAVVAALHERHRSGRGQHVESSMHEAAVLSLTSALSAVIDRGPGVVPERTANRHPALSVAPYDVYPAADGHVAINCPSQAHWVALVGLLDAPSLLDDPRFADPVARTGAMDDLDVVISSWTRGRTRDELVAALSAAGVPCAPVRTVPEVLEDPHLRAREAWVATADPTRGQLRLPRAPIRFDAAPPAPAPRPAPDLGADTVDVLRDLLGLTDDELRDLARDGAIGSPGPAA